MIPETKLFAVTQPITRQFIKRTQVPKLLMKLFLHDATGESEDALANSENISVVDTEGRILSTGVMARMEKKIKESQEKAELYEKVMPKSVGKGAVIIPEIEDIMDWFQLKYNYETVLEKKAQNQLDGVLPVGSYKTAVTIDLNSVTKTGAPDVKQIITSVVVDEQFEEVELNADTRNQVKMAIAGAVGYIEGRDQIHLSKASFLPKRVELEAPLEEVKIEKVTFQKESLWTKTKRILRLWPILLMGFLATAGIFISFKVITSLISGIKSVIVSILKSLAGLFKQKPTNNEPDDADNENEEGQASEDIELSSEEVINNLKIKSDLSKVIQLKALSNKDVALVVESVKDLMKG